jgi:hypothetical protein
MGVKLMLTDVRGSFLVLGEPKPYKEGDPARWSASALIPADSPQRKKVDAVLEQLAKEKWDKKWQTTLEAVKRDPKGCCWADGNLKDFDGYADHWVLSAHRYQKDGRPLVFDQLKHPLYQQNGIAVPGKEGVLYSGCFINMHVEIWAQQNTNGKGIRATLLGVQLVRKGDSFGGGSMPDENDFTEMEVGADADAFGGGEGDLG